MDWSLIILLLWAGIFVLSTFGASFAWWFLRTVNSQKWKAHALYLFHLSTYAVMAVYLLNYHYFFYENVWLGSRVVEYILYVNLGTALYIHYKYEQYFKIYNNKVVSREAAEIS
ncbi:MAG: hypothetical protein WC788_03590 [Candidatus Paceibacterota bacterium]|jgi:hypothetical protein